MSKIEKALQKARSAVSQVGSAPTPMNHGALVPVIDRAAPGPTSVGHYDSSGSIARMREATLLGRDELIRRGLIFPELSENSTVKAFREIRTKIIQKSQGRNCVIMVASPVENGGATFVSVNLAAAFAFDAGRTALVADCNFRQPSFQQYFDVEKSRGLTDYLEDRECDVPDVIHSVGIPRLRVVPAGTRRNIPSEYFTSARMKSLLDGIRTRYRERFIFLDAAPMAASADSQILAELCDFIVIVIPYGRLTARQIEDVLKGLDRRKVVGLVFNDVPHFPPMRLPSAKEFTTGLRKWALSLRKWVLSSFGKFERVVRVVTQRKK